MTAKGDTAHCARCGANVPGSEGDPTPCRACGQPDPNLEPVMDGRVQRLSPYYVLAAPTDGDRVLTFELRSVRNPDVRATIELPHRLKNEWRKQREDHKSKDGSDLVVAFDKPDHGPDSGKWIFGKVQNQWDPAALRCQVHAWGLGVGISDRNIYNPAHALYVCTCGTPCALCQTALAASKHNSKGGGWDQTLWARIHDEARREAERYS